MEFPSFLDAARRHADRVAIIADRPCTYRELLARAHAISVHLLGDRQSLDGERVAFLIPPGIEHVAVQWGIWLAGGMAVPLAHSHPPAELRHVIENSEASWVIVEPSLSDRVESNSAYQFVLTTDFPKTPNAKPDPIDSAVTGAALMVYTSGTTGKPKGVVTTHQNINAQVASLHEAWGWTKHDRILLVLPLHHVHGIVNVLCSALWAGACCEMTDRFDPADVWERLASGQITLFMGVPTTYRKLIGAWEEADDSTQQRWSEGARQLRLMVSGSAALPVSTHRQWEDVTGHALLERYGMTEIGMALGNPLKGERRAGTVGQPLPLVEVKLRVDPEESGAEGAPGDPGYSAEILVRGPTVFGEYWRRPQETADAFEDGWFKTGDTAVIEDGYYRILGRISVDIIKTGGYKISALEIEEVCRTHDAVLECAVVGVPDDEWGERVCIAVECAPNINFTLADLKEFTQERLAPYKIPRDLLIVDVLPRNVMGKVTKPVVAQLFQSKETEPK